MDMLQLSRARRRLPPPALRRLIRERARLTLAEVGEVVGVSESAVCRWERGQGPGRRHVTRYMDVLDRLLREAT